MSTRFTLCAALTAVVLAVAWPFLAFAQEVVVTEPDTGNYWMDLLSTWADALQPIVVTIVIPLVALWLKKKWGIDGEKVLREGFQVSASNAAGWLVLTMGQGAAKAGGLDPNDPDVMKAIAMVKGGAADAIEKFSISNEAIIKRIEAYIGKITGLTDDAGKPLASAAVRPAGVFQPVPAKPV